MAKNYTFAEAVEIIHAGVDHDSIADIGRRYPILLHKVTKVTSKAGADFVDLMGYMPDYLTANKVNTALKNAGGATESEAENEVPDATETESEATETTGSTDYESMSGKELWDLLGKAGKRKLAKSTKKADLVEACKQAFGAGAETEVEADEVEAETEEASEANPYEGISAPELFKECKKRGIKAPARKTAKFYAELLVKDDAKATEPAEEAGDGWDEEEETETPKPAAKAKKEDKKPAKKAAKKEEPADEDDDWDI